MLEVAQHKTIHLELSSGDIHFLFSGLNPEGEIMVNHHCGEEILYMFRVKMD